MIITLAKAEGNTWEVETSDPEFVSCDTIELASGYLVEKGVSDDEIDLALISIYAHGHQEATFTDGKFIASV